MVDQPFEFGSVTGLPDADEQRGSMVGNGRTRNRGIAIERPVYIQPCTLGNVGRAVKDQLDLIPPVVLKNRRTFKTVSGGLVEIDVNVQLVPGPKKQSVCGILLKGGAFGDKELRVAVQTGRVALF